MRALLALTLVATCLLAMVVPSAAVTYCAGRPTTGPASCSYGSCVCAARTMTPTCTCAYTSCTGYVGNAACTCPTGTASCSYGTINCPARTQAASCSCNTAVYDHCNGMITSRAYTCPVGAAVCTAGTINCPAKTRAMSCTCNTAAYDSCTGMVTSAAYTCPTGAATCATSGVCNCATGVQPMSCSCNTAIYDHCTGAVTSQTCSCSASWTYSDWGACSVSCGIGTQTRTGVCKYSDGQTAPNAKCSTAVLSQTCTPAPAHCYAWSSGTWSTCSKTCGPGTQTRSVVCLDQTASVTVADSYCTGTKPVTSQSCSLGDCYSWHSSDWSTCSQTCGPGTQTRSNTCWDDTTGVISTGSCATLTVPATSQSCKVVNCYAWQTDAAWGACSLTCSYGTQTRAVWCQDTTANVLSSTTANCAGTSPAASQACYTPCTNAYLKSFTVSSVIFAFTKTTYIYSVQIPYAYGSATVDGLPEDSTATVVWSPTTKDVTGLWYPTVKSVTATVTAQDGVTQHTYTAKIQRAPSPNAYLSSFVPSVGSISPAFSPTTFVYTLALANPFSSLTMTATLQDTTAQITSWTPSDVVASLPVSPSTTVITVATLAQDATTKQSYKVTVTRARSSVCTLAALSVTCASTAHMTPAFESNLTSYTMSGNLNPSITYVVLTATLTDDTGSLQYQLNSGTLVSFTNSVPVNVPVPIGDSILEIIVTAQTGTDTLTYSQALHKVSPVSTLASITSPNGGTLAPVFASAKTSYVWTFPNAITSVSVVPTTTSQYASAQYLFGGADGVVFASGATISGLTLARAGAQPLQILVTSEDSSSVTAYTFTLYRLDNNVLFQSVVTSAGTLAPTFQSTILSYSLTLVASVTSLSIAVAPNSAVATLAYVANNAASKSLPNGVMTKALASVPTGDSTIAVTLTSEDKLQTSTLTIAVHKLSANSDFANVSESTASLTPTFSSTVYSYTVTLDASTSILSVLPTPLYSTSTLAYQYQSSTWITFTTGSSITGLSAPYGDTSLLIRCTSEDASSSHTLSILVHRVSPNVALANLVLSSGSLTPPFQPTTFAYALTVDSGALRTTFTATTDDVFATLSYAVTTNKTVTGSGLTYKAQTSGAISPDLPLSVGDNFIVIRVTSEDGTTFGTTVAVIHRLDWDSSLASLKPSLGTLSPAFKSSVLEYNLLVPTNSTVLSVAFTTTSPFATVTSSWSTVSPTVATSPVTGLALVDGTTTFTLFVQSEDAAELSVYSVHVRRPATDSALLDLSLERGLLAPTFHTDTRTYATTLAATVNTATLTATPRSTAAIVQLSIDGGKTYANMTTYSKVMDCSVDFTATIRVIADDGSSSFYTLAMHRLSADARLKSLKLTPGGTWSPVFSPSVFTYAVVLPPSALTLKAVATFGSPLSTRQYTLVNGIHAGATTSFDTTLSELALTDGANSLTVAITSEDNTANSVYTFALHRVSTICTLSELYLSSSALTPSFSSSVLEYTVGIASAVDFFAVTPIASATTANLSIAVTLGAEDPSSSSKFAPIASSQLSELYTLPAGPSVLQIRVLAEDGVSQSVYTIRLRRTAGDALLEALVPSVGQLQPVFQASVRSYTIAIPVGVDSFQLYARTQHPAATISALTSPSTLFGVGNTAGQVFVHLFNQTVSAIVGDNYAQLTIVAEDQSNTTTVQVTMHRMSNDASLAAVVLIPATTSFVFAPETLEYDITEPAGVSQLSFLLTPSDAGASVTYAWNAAVFNAFDSPGLTSLLRATIGDNLLLATVTAEDLITTRTYTMRLHRQSNDVSLRTLAFDQTPLDVNGLNFSSTQLSYTLGFASTMTSLTFTASATYSLATVSYTWSQQYATVPATTVLASGATSSPLPLVMGFSVLTVTVTSEDGNTRQYVVTIARMSDDASLTSFVLAPVGEGFVPPFDTDVLAYSNRLANLDASASVMVVTSNTFATIALRTAPTGTEEWSEAIVLTSGSLSAPVELPVGQTDARVTVTAQDGLHSRNYTVTLVRLSADAHLVGVEFEVLDSAAGGVWRNVSSSLVPSFAFGQLSYTLTVANLVHSLRLRPSPADETATIQYGSSTPSGLQQVETTGIAINTWTDAIPLLPAKTTVTLTVLSGDALNTLEYDVVVTRAADFTALSAMGAPYDLDVMMQPIFSPGVAAVGATVPYMVETVCFRPVYATYASGAFTITPASDSGAVTSLLSGQCGGNFAVAPAVANEFTVFAPTDPWTLSVSIYREAPVITTLGLTVPRGNAFFIAPLNFDPAVREYTSRVAFISNVLTLDIAFNAGELSLTYVPAIGEQQSIEVTNGTLSLDLDVGDNLLLFVHSLDGMYQYTITRDAPDVTALAVTGSLAGGGSRVVSIHPSFAGGVLAYTTAVPLIVTDVTFALTFTTPGTVTFNSTAFEGTTVPVSGVLGASIPLPVNLSTFTISSRRDGDYTVIISRSNADMMAIQLAGRDILGVTSGLVLAPVFLPGVLATCRVTVPKSVLTVTVEASFYHADTSTLNSVAASTASASLVTDVPSKGVVLQVGENSLTVFSTLDGTYSFIVTRSPADIQKVTLAATQQDGTVLTDVAYSPASVFSVNQREYAVSVPFKVKTLRVRTQFLTPTTVGLVTGTASTQQLYTGMESNSVSLSVGAQVVNVSSSLDGVFSWRVTQAAPDMTSLALTQTASKFGWLSAPSAFSSALYSYAASAPYITDVVTLRVTFATPGSVQVVLNGAAPVTLISGTSLDLRLELGTNSIIVTSLFDGVYTFVVSRAALDLSAVAFVTYTGSGAPSTTSVVPSDFTPAFKSNTTAYTLTVPSVVTAIAMRAYFRNAAGLNTVSVESVSVASGVLSAPLSLKVGVNTFKVTSLADATYTFVVTRLVPDVVMVTPTSDSSLATAAPLVFTPSFNSGINNYTLSIPFLLQMLALTVEYTHADDVLSVSDGRTMLPVTVLNATKTRFQSSALVVAPESTTFTLASSYDASYFFRVTRRAPDVTGLELSGVTLSGGIDPPVVQQLPSPFIGSDTAFKPTFTAGTMAYTLTVPFTVTALRVNLTFGVFGSVSLSLNGGSGVPLVSGVASSDLPLSVGTQTIRFASNMDGVYTLTVTRTAEEMKKISLLVQSKYCDTDPTACLTAVTTVTNRSTTVSVPWHVASVAFLAEFATVKTVFLYDVVNGTVDMLSDLYTGGWTQQQPLGLPEDTVATIPLETLVTRYYLLSLQDGLYTIDFARALPDVQGVSVSVDGVVCAASSSGLLATSTSGASNLLTDLVPGMQYGYQIEVPYAATAVALSITFGEQWISNRVLATIVNTDHPENYVAMRSGQAQQAMELLTGDNRIYIASESDGNYTITVTRATMALSKIALTGSAAVDNRSSAFDVAPLFSPAQSVYTSQVPPGVDSIVLTFTTTDESDVFTLTPDNGEEAQTLSVVEGLVTTGAFSIKDLTTLTFSINSLHDGCFSLIVTRIATPVLRGVNVTRTVTHEASMPFAQASDKLRAKVASGSSGLNSDQLATFNAVYGDFSSTSALNVSVPVALAPEFVLGWLGPYDAKVGSDATRVRLQFDVMDPTALTCILHGYPYHPDAQGAVSVAVTAGVNSIVCRSDDGDYVFRVTRGSTTFRDMQVPTSLYAVETRGNITIGTLESTEDLTCALLVSDGTMSATSVVLDGSPDAVVLSLTAPDYLSAGSIFVAVLCSGTDAWAYPLAPLFIVAVQPRVNVTLGGLASFYYSLQNVPTLSLTTAELPNAGEGIVVDVTLVRSVVGSTVPIASLTLSSFASTANFTFVAPEETEGSEEMLLRFTMSGPDVVHFLPIPDAPVLVLVRSSFYLTQLPSLLYVTQSVTLKLTPHEAPSAPVSVSINVAGSGHLFNNAGLARTPLQLLFPADSTDAITFVYTAATTLGSNLTEDVTLSFNLAGDDVAHYLVVPSSTFTVTNAVALDVANVPSALLNRGVSGAIRVTLPYAPPQQVTVRLACNNSEAVLSPTFLAFTTTSDRTQSFVLYAPTWYTDGAPLLVTWSLVGADAGIYAAPAPLLIEMERQPADVKGVSFYALGTDERPVLLSGVLAPFVGYNFQYAYDMAIAVMDPTASSSTSSSSSSKKVQSSHSSQVLSSVSNTVSTDTATVRIAVYPHFASGSLSLRVTTDLQDGSSTTTTEVLASDTRSNWYEVLPGRQSFALVSSLDGTYAYNFTYTEVTDSSTCFKNASTALNSSDSAVVYGLPTASYVSSTAAALPASVVPTRDASAAPILFCATVDNVQAAAQKLIADNTPSGAIKVSFGLSENVATNWLWILLLVIYFFAAIGGGHVLGGRRALQEEKRISLKLVPSLVALWEGKPTGTTSALSAPAASGVHLPAGLDSAPTSTFAQEASPFSSPAFFMLLLCLCRCVDMLVYFSFYTSMSAQVTRLVTILPQLLVPWLVAACLPFAHQYYCSVATSIGATSSTMLLLQAKERRWSARLRRVNLVWSTCMFLLMVVMTAAPLDADLLTKLDILLVGTLALLAITHAGIIAWLAAATRRMQTRAPTYAAPAPIAGGNGAWSRSASSRALQSDVVTSAAYYSSTPPNVMYAATVLVALLLAVVVSSGLTFLSVTASTFYSSSYQSYVLVFCIAECVAFLLVLAFMRAVLAAERAHLSQFTVAAMTADRKSRLTHGTGGASSASDRESLLSRSNTGAGASGASPSHRPLSRATPAAASLRSLRLDTAESSHHQQQQSPLIGSVNVNDSNLYSPSMSSLNAAASDDLSDDSELLAPRRDTHDSPLTTASPAPAFTIMQSTPKALSGSLGSSHAPPDLSLARAKRLQTALQSVRQRVTVYSAPVPRAPLASLVTPADVPPVAPTSTDQMLAWGEEPESSVSRSESSQLSDLNDDDPSEPPSDERTPLR